MLDELINSGNSLDDLCESFLNVILQAAGESIPNKIITTSLLHWFDAISIWLLSYQNKVLFIFELC
jgi:hypothetical protein